METTKCGHGLVDTGRYWYLRVKKELIKLGADVNSIDQGLFYCEKNTINLLEYLPAMLMTWSGEVMKTLKSMLSIILRKLSCLVQKKQKLLFTRAYNLTINQNNYIDCISEIKLSNERLKEKNSLLFNEEKKHHVKVL